MTVIIDRFEGDFAIVELPDGNFSKIPKVLVSDFKEGDVVRIEKDIEETERKRNKAQEAFSALLKK